MELLKLKKCGCLFACITFIGSISVAIAVADGGARLSGDNKDEMFTWTKNVKEVNYNYELPQYENCEVSGNGVQFVVRGDNCVVEYNNIINVNALEPTENLIEFQALYDDNYEALAADNQDATLTVKLIDAHNENNYFTVTYEQYKLISAFNWWNVYTRAGFNGVEWGELGRYGTHRLETGSEAYGSLLLASFYGQGKVPFNIQYDSTEKIVTLNNGEGYVPVIDLDNEAQVGEGKAWGGFTTGEVYLQLIFPNTVTTSSIVVTEIAGQSLAGATSLSDINDAKGPAIHIDLDADYKKDGLPFAKVGQNYPLPNVWANDMVAGETDVTVLVENIATSKTYAITEQGVVVDMSGEYRITYTSTDKANNVSKEYLYFTAKDNIEPVKIAFENEPEEILIGKAYSIPRIMAQGGSGKVEYYEEFLFNGEKYVPDYRRNICLPYIEGQEKYTFQCVVYVKDYLASEYSTVIFDFDVIISEKPIVQIYGLPQVAFVDKTLVFPDFEAVDYANGGIEAAKFIRVNGKILGVDRKYTVSETDGKSLAVEYIAGTGAAQVSSLYYIPVKKVQTIADYILVDDSVKYEVTNEYVEYVAENDFTMTAPNALPANVETIFSISPERNNIGYLQVRLVDYYDESIALTFKVTPHESDSSASRIQVNGEEKSYTLSGSFYDETPFYFFFDNTQKALCRENKDVICNVNATENGENFNGFSSGLVRLQIKTCNTTDENAIRIYSIGNQTFNAYGLKTRTSAQLVFSEKIETRQISFGEKIVIPAARAYDVLDFNSSVTVSLSRPDGRLIYNKIKCDTTYYYESSEYGTYIVIYHITDASGNTEDLYYYIGAVDKTAPTIDMVGEISTTHKKGNAFIVPNIYVEDERDGVNCEISVYIIGKKCEKVSIGQTYAFGEEGVYVLVYYVTDMSGNVNILRKTIEVIK